MSVELSSTSGNETMISVLRSHVQNKGDQVLFNFWMWPRDAKILLLIANCMTPQK